jgi:enoyl-CoA hydratase/carnithine racemase
MQPDQPVTADNKANAMTILFNTDEHGVATITLNRPERLNAFNREMLDEWNAALLKCGEDPAIKVVVLTGAGRGFCSGGDAGDMKKRSDGGDSALDRKDFLFRNVHRIALTMERLDKPVIAAVNGAARGAGMDMALMCDIRIAAASATFAESYIDLALMAGDGGGWYLPRLTGLDQALDLIWTGRKISAQEARELGVVTRVVPDDELMSSTYEYARRLAHQPQHAVRFSKRTIYQGLDMSLIAHLDMVSSHMAVLRDTEEYRAKVAEFAERKRVKG